MPADRQRMSRRLRPVVVPPPAPEWLNSPWIEDWLAPDEIDAAINDPNTWPAWSAHQRQRAAQTEWLEEHGILRGSPEAFARFRHWRYHPHWRHESNARRERDALRERLGGPG